MGMQWGKDHTIDEIKTLFRKAVFSAHPDKGGSHEECVKINAAYEWLKYLCEQSITIQAKKPTNFCKISVVVFTYASTNKNCRCYTVPEHVR